MPDRPHDEAMVEIYRNDPAFAASLLNDVLEDGDADEIRHYLALMNAAFAGGSGLPGSIDALLSTIHAMGCRLAVAPVPEKPTRQGGVARTQRKKRAVETV